MLDGINCHDVHYLNVDAGHTHRSYDGGQTGHLGQSELHFVVYLQVNAVVVVSCLIGNYFPQRMLSSCIVSNRRCWNSDRLNQSYHTHTRQIKNSWHIESHQ